MGETTSCFKLITTFIKLLANFPVSQNGNFRWNSYKTFYFFTSLLLSLTYFILNIYENVSGYGVLCHPLRVAAVFNLLNF